MGGIPESGDLRSGETDLSSSVNVRVREFDSVASTNVIVKDAIRAGEPEGLVVSAFQQTAGYGRQGRTWVSPYGGLYVSMMLRPEVPSERLSTIALVTALAVREALAALVASGADVSASTGETSRDNSAGLKPACGDAPDRTSRSATDFIQVKWPNDVVCAQGKLCGISTEVVHGAVCIGIGINVFVPAGEMVVEGKNSPAYLSSLLPSGLRQIAPSGLVEFERATLTMVRDKVIDSFFRRYGQWDAHGFAAFAQEFRACSSLAGSAVDIVSRTGERMAAGIVIDIDDAGRLLLRDDEGNVRAISSGEAHIRAIAD